MDALCEYLVVFMNKTLLNGISALVIAYTPMAQPGDGAGSAGGAGRDEAGKQYAECSDAYATLREFNSARLNISVASEKQQGKLKGAVDSSRRSLLSFLDPQESGYLKSAKDNDFEKLVNARCGSSKHYF